MDSLKSFFKSLTTRNTEANVNNVLKFQPSTQLESENKENRRVNGLPY